MTDLEKWKNLLNSVNIKYKERNELEPIFDDYYNLINMIPMIILDIDQSHLENKRNAGLEIIFLKDGAFSKFSTFGL